MFEYLKYKLTGRVPSYLRILKIAGRYGWSEPEVTPAAWYIVEVTHNGTGLKAFWNYKKRSWVVRSGEADVDRGVGFETFVRALKAWRKYSSSDHRASQEARP
jgi:hypothetical protein